MNSYDIQKEYNENEPSHCGINYRLPIDGNYSQINEKSSKIECEIICSIPYFCHGLRYPKQAILIVLYSIFYIIGTSLLSTSNAVGSSIGFASLSEPKLFGTQRVWGTIGFGIIAFITSRIYELFHSEYVYVIMFNIVSILTIVVTCFIPIRKVELTEEKKKGKFDSSALVSLLKNVDAMVFLSITFVWGMCFGCMQPVNRIRF